MDGRTTGEAPLPAAIDIALANDLREIAGVAARIEAFCAARQVAPEIAYAVNLAIDELLSNTIGYGYGDDEPHRIEVLVRLEGDAIVTAIVDDGEAFDPTQAREADTDSPLDERKAGGLGLLLVNRMMDRVEYRRKAGCNVVTLTKKTTADAPAPGRREDTA